MTPLPLPLNTKLDDKLSWLFKGLSFLSDPGSLTTYQDFPGLIFQSYHFYDQHDDIDADRVYAIALMVE